MKTSSLQRPATVSFMTNPFTPERPSHGFLSASGSGLLLACVVALLGLPATAAPDSPPEGLSAADWSGIRAAYEAERHQVVGKNDGTRIARNPGQRWNTAFDGRGFEVTPDAGGWTWGLELKSYGFAADDRQIAGHAKVSHQGGEVNYDWDGNLREWFVNDSRGLQQGWTLRERPPGAGADDTLRLTFAIRGGLEPDVDAGGTTVSFQESGGRTALNFSGLQAWDADGLAIPASFTTTDGDASTLQVVIEESVARYPITIDPVAQEAYIKASNTDWGDQFGTSVAASGNTVVVGAWSEDSATQGINGAQDNNGRPNSGAVYVFVRDMGVWSQQAYVKSSNSSSGDWFGYSVAIDGDTMVVGAPGRTSQRGTAFVFVRSGTTWTEQAQLTALNPRFLGSSIAISGDTTVIGSPYQPSASSGVNGDETDSSAWGAGAAYVFVRSGSTWAQEAFLKASAPDADDEFGDAVAISDDTIVVGAHWESSNATGINGNDADNSAFWAGAAYIFHRSGTTWTQQAYVKASNADSMDEFGTAVCASGDTVVVGSAYEASGAKGINGVQTDNGAGYSGAAYVFTRSGTTWSQQAYLKASDSASGLEFGRSLSMSEPKLAVGADSYAYVFTRFGTTWNEQSILAPSNPGIGYAFGTAIGLSGDVLVVGDYSEASIATGINGDQYTTEPAANGAAYAYNVPTLTPPDAGDDAITLAEGATATTLDGGASSVLDNDTDPEPTDTLTVNTTPVTPPSHGSLTLNSDGTFSYTHDGSENLADVFVYEVSDPAGDTDEGTVTITVTPVNDQIPVASSDTVTVDEGAATSVLDGGSSSVLSNDSDGDSPGDNLTAVLEDDVDLGSLTLDPDGTFTYTHDGSEAFSDSFTYHANDGLHDSNTVTVTITITPDNDTDGDDMDDTYEQAIIDADEEDDIATIADVLPDDDFDGDGRSNLEEETDGTDPTDRGSTLGLEVWCPFDGDANDHSGNGRNGTLYGAALAEGVSGDPDGAYHFDGTDDWIDLGFQATWPEATFACWVKVESPAGYWRLLDNGGQNGGGHLEAFLGVDTYTSPSEPVMFAGRWNKWATLEAQESDDEWVFVVGVFADDETSIWVNGSSAVTTEGAPYGVVGSAQHTFRIARSRDDPYYFKGLIDDIRIYSRALADGEVAALHAGFVSQNPPDADPESFTVAEGATATETDLDEGATLLDGDTGVTLTIDTTPASGPSHGSLTLNSDGTFSYTHDGSDTLNDSFTYTLRDAADNTATATVTITILADDDEDGMADVYEQTIIDADEEDDIATIADVLPDDDFDGDGRSNLEEETDGTDPTDPNDTLGLLAYYLFDGDADDSSGNANHGTWGGDTVYEAGLLGSSASFDGNDSVTTPIDPEPATMPDFTMAAWVKADSVGGGTERRQIASMDDAGYDRSVMSYGGAYAVFLQGNGFWTPGADLSVGQWQHMVVAYNGTTDSVSFYLNGTAYGSNPLPTVTSDTSIYTWTLGRNPKPTTDEFFRGKLDEVRLYDRALGGTEAAALYAAPFNLNPPVADAEGFTVVEGATATEADLDDGATLLDGDTGIETIAGSLTVDTTPASGPSYGSVTLNADGTFSYTHDGSENFSDSFTYNVEDEAGNTGTGTVTITILPDEDEDGMADVYEQAIIDADPLDDLIVFADVLPGDDFDGDGRTNLEEQGDGTDPTDRGSTLGLEVWYPLDGDVNDYSGNDRHGTLYGATLTDGISGNPNSAYHFDGIDDWIDMGFQDSWSEATFSCWVKVEAPGGYRRIMENGGTGGAHAETFLVVDATSPTQPGLGAARWNKPVYLDAHDSDVEWTFVVGVFRDNQTKIWVNGSSAATTDGAPYGPVQSVDLTHRIARFRDNSYDYYQGYIDDVRIYSRALGESEITALSTSPDTTPRPDIVIGEAGFRVLDLGGSEVANPSVGESVTLEVTVNNDGLVATDEPVEVRVFQDGAPTHLANYDVAAFDVLATGTIVDNLEPGESRAVTMPWTVTGSDRISVLTAVAELQSNRSTSQDNADYGTSNPLPKPEQTLGNNSKARSIQIGTPTQGAYGITVDSTAPTGMLSGVQYTLTGTAEYDFGGNNPVLGGLVEVSVNGQLYTTYTGGVSGSWSVLLDSLPVGIHTALIQVSDGNLSGSKNLELDVAQGPQTIDLQVVEIGYAGGTYRTDYETAWAVTGTGVTLRAWVKNNGNTAAGAFDFEFKAPDGSTIATESVAGLAAGAETWVTASASWAPATAGSHLVSAIADSGAAIGESNESNNTRSATVHATADLPDLIVKNIDWSPTSPVQDQDGTYVATIQNIGSATISAGTSFDTRFTLAGSLIVTQGHTLAADLATGATVDVQTTIPATGLSPGGTTILAEADVNSAISEIEDANNNRTETVTIRIALPDLRPYSLLYGWQQVSGLAFSPSNPITGDAVTITCDIWNTGSIDVPAGSYDVDFTADGSPVATETLTLSSPLAPGAKTSVQTTWTTGPAADVAIAASVDTGSELTEENEGNNATSKTLTVYPVGVGITASDLVPSVYQPFPDTAITLTATVTNNGGSPSAGNHTVTFYHGNPSGSGVVIGTQTITAPIAATGGVAYASIAWTTPSSPQTADLYAVVEGSEFRYDLTVTNSPDPDFAVHAGDITLSNNQPVEGEVVTVSATVSNLAGSQSDALVSFAYNTSGLWIDLGTPVLVEDIDPDTQQLVPASADLTANSFYYTIRVTVEPYPGTNNDANPDDNVATTSIARIDAPLAHAGPDQLVFAGDTVTLDGSGSVNVGTYEWLMLSIPASSTAALSDPAVVAPQFTADLPGSYLTELVVSSGGVHSPADTVTVTAVTPTLDVADLDEELPADTVVGTFSATGGSGPFTWALVAGSGDDDNALFSIDGSDLKVASPVDYETQASVAIRVSLTDTSSGLSLETSFALEVNPVNDNSPVADPESFTVAEGGTATEAALDAGATLLDGDTDADLPNDSLTIDTTPAVPPQHGSLTLNSDGTFSYTHDGSETTSDSFTYHVRDAADHTTTATVAVTVILVNDNPPVAGADTLPVLEGGTATTLSGGVPSVLDNDADADTGDTLTVDAAPVAGPSHGSLTLNSDGTFSYTHDDSEILADSFTYTVRDAADHTATGDVTIIVTPVNDNTPVAISDSIELDEGATATTLVGGATALQANDTDTDLPNDTLTIDATPVSSPSHGSLTLFANGTFSYTHDDSENFSDSFTYQVRDEADHTATATVTITVNPVNENPPVTDPESFTVAEGATATEADLDEGATLLDGDTDEDTGDSITIDTTPVAGPSHGNLTLNANGTFSYTHDDSENLVDSFTYRARDEADNTATATVTITVTPVNDNTPTGIADNIELDEGATATSLAGAATTVLANDSDPDLPNDTLTADTTPVSPPSHGSLVLNSDGTFSYTHDDSENLSDSFVYQVRDEADHTSTATVTITINPVNDNTPVADAESFTLNEGATATQADLDGGTTLLDGDTDVDLPHDTLTIDTTPVSGPSNGNLTLFANGTFSYIHDDSENFSDSFTYTMRDEADHTATAVVTITVNPVNENPPSPDPESFTVAEGGTATEADLDEGATLLDGDTDEDTGDSITIDTTPVAGPSHGILTLNANGTFSYTHDDSENLIDSFTYRARDEADNTATATVTITVTPVNDNTPVGVADDIELDEGATATSLVGGATVLQANDTDPDLPNDTLTADTTPVSPPSHGSLVLNSDGTFSYTHDDSENFSDSFVYQVRDEADHTSTATVTITINPVNDNTPVADAESFTLDEGATATQADLDNGTTLLDGDTDVDLPHDDLTVDTSPAAGPSHGNLTLNPDGTFHYVHDGTENFTDSFTYTVRDEADHTATAVVTITVNPVNENPPSPDPESFTVAEGGTATESSLDTGVTLLDGDTDVDLPHDTLSIDTTPAAGPSHGSLTLNADGTFSYTHDDSENLVDSFTYTLRDEADHTSTATVTITVTPVNDNTPVGVADNIELDEGATATSLVGGATVLQANDTDPDLPNDTLTVDTTPVSGPSHGSLTLNADGTFNYTHDDSENFNDSFTYQVRDEADHTSTASVTITINPVNDNTPVADAESFTLNEGATATQANLDDGATLLDGDTDGDLPLDSLTIDTTPAAGPAHGILTLNADGTFSYIHDGSENFSDSFTYQIRDAADHASTATVSITITPVNDNDPVANGDSMTLDEGESATTLDGGSTSVLGNDTDTDLPYDTLTIDTTPVAAPAHGSLTLNPNGTFSYTHDDTENFTDSFTYTLRDQADHTTTATVTITINPVNDNTPVASAESTSVDEGGTVATLEGGATSVLANDNDADLPGDPLTAILDDDVNHGTLTLNADGTFSYTHDDSENLTDAFSYHVHDGTNNSDTVVVPITINPVNDNTPVADTESFTLDEGTAATHADLDDGSSLLDGDTDLDLPFDTLSIDSTPAVAPQHGSLTLNSDGTFSYTHDDSENFADSFTYTLRDEADHTTTAVVSITVNPVNDNTPVADAESFTLDEGATASHANLDVGASLLDGDSDVDLPHDALAIDTTPAVAPQHGSLTLNSDGTFSYTHDGSENFADSFTYTLRDEADHTATAVVSITVNPVNDHTPVADTESFTLDEGATATHANLDSGATLLDGDTDVDLPHDTLTIDTTPVVAPQHGSLTLNSDGTFSYTHDDSENFSDSFTYTLRDGADHTATAVVSITINPVNDNIPVADAESFTLDEGATASHADLDDGASLLDGDSDIDLPQDTLTIDTTPVVAPQHGSLALNSDGTFSYTHDGSENFADSFTYTLRDEADHTTTAFVSITVNPVNDNTPVADAESFTLDEGATATHADLDDGASLLDGDSDVDLPHDALAIDTTPVVAPQHGSLALFADGTFSYTHDDSEAFTDSFTYRVRDEADHTTTAVVSITVNPVNDNTPVADTESFTLDEGATATHANLDDGASLLDGDSDADLPHDALTIDTTPAVAPQHGSLTLNADGTFSYTHDGSENFADSFTYTLRDEADHTTTAVVSITVNPVNDNTPVAEAESFTLDEGATATHANLDDGASLLDGDSDADLPHDALTIDTTPAVAPQHGSLALNSDGTFSYTHDDSENFSDSFTYTLRDEADHTATAVVSITVNPVNDNTPVADAESFTLDEGATATHANLDDGTSLLDGDSDADLPHDALTIDTTPVVAPQHGSLTLSSDGTFSYTHDGSENFADSFTYTLRDEADHTTTAVVSITVNPVNDNTPVADAESFTLDEGATATHADLDDGVSLLDGDTDVDLPHDALTIDTTPVGAPQHGSLTLNSDGTFSYTHDGSENFADSFTYTLRDEADHTTTAVVSITVNPVNDNTPVADAESFTLDEGATATHADLDDGVSLLDGDTDVDLPHDALTIDTTPAVAPQHGSLTLNSDGTFSYTHDDSENFADSFTYTLRDEADHTTTAVVSITVNPVNDNTPVADAESFTLDEGATATHADLDDGVSLLDGDTDVDLPHDALAIDTTPVVAPQHGSLTLNSDGTFSYTHDGSENFSDSFTYRVRDEADHTTTAFVSITVNPVNDNTPVADAESFTLDEGAAATHADLDDGATLLDGDTDVDLPHDDLAIDTTPAVAPQHGSLTLNSNGTFSYTHDDSENFADSFTYTLRDEADHTTTAVVSITVNPVNDNTPVANADSITVNEGGSAISLDGGGTSVLSNDSDADLPGDTLTAVLDDDVDHGNLTLNADGTFSYVHDDGEDAADSFSYHVHDGAHDSNTVTVTITITPVNDNAPVANAESVTVDEGATATTLDGGATSLLANDTDTDLPDDTLTVNTTPVAGPSHGSLTLNSNGTFSYTHDDSENFSDSFTYQVEDAEENTAQAVVTITISPVNDNTPVATADNIELNEGATANALVGGATTLKANDTDVDLPHDTLTIDTSPVTGPSRGSLTVNSDGTFSYTHDDSENFSDSFTYTLRDETNHTATGAVTITISPVNDQTPVANPETITVIEGGTVTTLDGGATSVLANDTDADLPGDTLTAVLDANAEHGSLTLNSDGTFSYTHGGNQVFSDSFSYHVHDGVNDSDVINVPITIDQTPPVITSSLVASGDQNKNFSYQITADHHPSSFNATGLPTGLSVNTATGLITGQPTSSGETNVTISATNSGGADQETLVITIAPEPPVITSSLSATAVRDVSFNYQITATNSPTNFSATGLPAGLGVNTDTGLISGTPTAIGTSSVTIGATNAGGTAQKTLTLVVRPPAPSITSALTASGTVDEAFSYQITATENPQTFAANGLPAGLTINPATGLVSGFPTEDGVFSVSLEAGNGYGTGNATLTLTVDPLAPAITSPLTAAGELNKSFSYQITATNSPTSFNATGLPAGLGVNTTNGLISGTPTSTGAFSVTISATNAGGTGNAVLELEVARISLAWVRIGNPGNAADTTDGDDLQDGNQFYGAVAQEFDIGRFEVTNEQYVEFLNAVAASDTHGLYGEDREWAFANNGIVRDGSPGSWTYAVKPDNDSGTDPDNMADKPVNFIHIYSAMRFANWLHNGQPSGPQNASTTEDGAYAMSGTYSAGPRKAGARCWVPSMNEWYKAAYYTGSGASYWLYPTHNNSIPTKATADTYGNINNDTGNIANYDNSFPALWTHYWPDPYDPYFTIEEEMSVTTVGSGGPGSESHYGAADMGGNVAEWTETYYSDPYDPGTKMWPLRGGDFQYGEYAMRSTSTEPIPDNPGFGMYPYGAENIGFRVAREAPAPDIPDIKPPFHATATSGVAFSYQIQASGLPDSYGASGLPAGLSVNTTTGLISGTPTTTGTSAVALTATNVDGTGNATLTLTVNPPAPVIGEESDLPILRDETNDPEEDGLLELNTSGIVGQPFTYQIAASNNPTHFGASGLPAGLDVNHATGLISGTPESIGVTPATISATNATGTDSATLTITIGPELPEITSELAADATEGQPFLYQIVASGSPTTYDAIGLPAGLSVDTNSGLISGTPATAGTSPVTIDAINASGSGSDTLVLTVHDPIPVITSADTAAGQFGQAFSHQVTATGNPVSFAAGGLPTGLAIATATGEISGVPTQYGSFAVIVTAINSQGIGSQNLMLTVGAGTSAPVITSAPTAGGMLGQGFTYQITATNSPTSYDATDLPAGLGIDTGSGIISGTPTTLGPTTVTISASNAAGSDSATLVITIRTDYAGWKAVVFDGPGEDDPAISGPDVDFDRDGVTNGMEYAVGLNPKVPDGPAADGGLVEIDGERYPYLVHEIRLYTVDVNLTPQISFDLESWMNGPAHVTESSRVDNGDGTETITVLGNTPVSSAPRGFMRLHLVLD